jgi:hypothetical protein
MKNQSKIGMKYKTKTMIFDETDGMLFENESEFAEYLGVTIQAIYNAKIHKRACKGYEFCEVHREFVEEL